jgi:sortase A
MRSARLVRATAALGALIGLVGCGSGQTEGPPPTIVEHTTSPTPVVAVSLPSTTIATTTTAAPTTVATTIATTTTAATLPQPAPAPDPSAKEPAIELGTIAIPKIGVTQTLYEGVTLSSLDRGPGHWPGTALPGQLGNVVIAGHRVSHARPFRHLEALAPGDQILLTSGGMRYEYLVTGTQIVGPNDVWIVDQKPEHTATLFACHPPGSTRERIVVFAKLAGT